jgi:hypothetical protein
MVDMANKMKNEKKQKQKQKQKKTIFFKCLKLGLYKGQVSPLRISGCPRYLTSIELTKST